MVKRLLAFLIAAVMTLTLFVPIGASDRAGIDGGEAAFELLNGGGEAPGTEQGDGDELITDGVEDDDGGEITELPGDDDFLPDDDEPIGIIPAASFALFSAEAETEDANGGYYIKASPTGTSKGMMFGLSEAILINSINK